jgi:S1-C subfamily serine protease
MRDGRIRRSRIGIAAETVMLNRRFLRRLGHPGATAVMVSEVIEGGAAERSGLASGDIMLKFDGQMLTGVDDLHRLLTHERAEKCVVLSVLRGPETQSLTIIPQSDG